MRLKFLSLVVVGTLFCFSQARGQCPPSAELEEAIQAGFFAYFWTNNGQIKTARDFAKKAIAKFEKIDCALGVAEVYLVLGQIADQEQSIVKQRSIIEKLRALDQQHHLPKEYVERIIFLEGSLSMLEGKYFQAIDTLSYLRGRYSQRKYEDYSEFEATHPIFSRIYQDKNRLAIYQNSSKGYLSNLLGIAYREIEAYKDAEFLAEEALDFFEAAGMWNNIAMGETGLGTIIMSREVDLETLENLEKRIKLTVDSLQSYKFYLTNSELMAYTHRILAKAKWKISEATEDKAMYETALLHYDTAIQQLNGNKFEKSVGVEDKIAALFAEKMQTLKSVTQAEYALALSTHYPDEANEILAGVVGLMDSINNISTKMESRVYYLLGKAARQLGQESAAFDFFSKVVQNKLQKNSQGSALLFRKIDAEAAYEMGQIKEEEAAKDSHNQKILLIEALGYYQIGVRYLRDQRANFTADPKRSFSFVSVLDDINNEAFKYFTAALRANSKLLTMAKANGPEDQVMSLREDIFKLIEQSKAYLLRLQIQQSKFLAQLSPTQKKALQRLREREYVLDTSIERMEKGIDTLIREEYQKMVTEKINARSALLKYFDGLKANNQFDEDKTRSIQEIQKRLKPKEAALNYLYDEDQLYVVLVKKNGATVQLLELPEGFEDNIIEFDTLAYHFDLNASIDKTDMDWQFAKVSNQLYQTLIAPVAAELKDVSEIVISRFGVLHRINFELLIDKPFKEKTDLPMFEGLVMYSQIPFLGKKMAVHHALSLSASQPEQSSPPKEEIYYLGFEPEYKSWEKIKSTLPVIVQTTIDKESEGFKEIGAVKSVLEDKQALYYESEQASEQMFMELVPKYQLNILHLSGHSFSDTEIEKPGFYFTNTASAKFDDALTQNEIDNMRIDAEVLILTACNSGISKEINQLEGMFSLARSFQTAGCKHILMGNSFINKNQAREIVKYFVDAIGKGDSAAKALKQAKQRYLENNPYSPPANWSSLVLLSQL